VTQIQPMFNEGVYTYYYFLHDFPGATQGAYPVVDSSTGLYPYACPDHAFMFPPSAPPPDSPSHPPGLPPASPGTWNCKLWYDDALARAAVESQRLAGFVSVQQFTIGAGSDVSGALQLYDGDQEVWGNPFPPGSAAQVNFKMRLAWFHLDTALNPSEDIPTADEFSTAFLAYLNYKFPDSAELGSSPSVTATLGDQSTFLEVETQWYNVQFSSGDVSNVLALLSNTTKVGCLADTDRVYTQPNGYNNIACNDGGPTPLQRSLRPYFDNHVGLNGFGYRWPLNWGGKTGKSLGEGTLANHAQDPGVDAPYGRDWDYDQAILTEDVLYVEGDVQVYPITFDLRLGWTWEFSDMTTDDIPTADEFSTAFLAYLNYKFTTEAELGTNPVVTATKGLLQTDWPTYWQAYHVEFSSSDPWPVWNLLSDTKQLDRLPYGDPLRRTIFSTYNTFGRDWEGNDLPGATEFQRSLRLYFDNQRLNGKGYNWPRIDWAGNKNELQNYYYPSYDWSYDRAIVVTEANNPNPDPDARRRMDTGNNYEDTIELAVEQDLAPNGTSTDMANHTHVHNAHALQGKLTEVEISQISRPTMPLGTSPHDPIAKRHTGHNPHALEGHLGMVNIANVTSTTNHSSVASSHSRRLVEALSTCGYYDQGIEYKDNTVYSYNDLPDQCTCRLVCGREGNPYYTFWTSTLYTTTSYCSCKSIRSTMIVNAVTNSGSTAVETGRFECTVRQSPP